VDDETFELHEAAKREIFEMKVRADALAQPQAQAVELDLAARAVRVRTHVDHVLNDLTRPKCPRCATKFADDFEACFAVSCMNPACRYEFCAWCLGCATSLCLHVRGSVHSPNGGEIYGTMAQWRHSLRRTLAPQRVELVRGYLESESVEEGDRAALVEALRGPLAELGLEEHWVPGNQAQALSAAGGVEGVAAAIKTAERSEDCAVLVQLLHVHGAHPKIAEEVGSDRDQPYSAPRGYTYGIY
jgi:hypothetical protein